MSLSGSSAGKALAVGKLGEHSKVVAQPGAGGMEPRQLEQARAKVEREGFIRVERGEVAENVSGDDGDEKVEFRKPRIQSNRE